MLLSPAERLGPYEIVSLLGAGGMGQVYRARDTRLERSVAVKVLARPGDHPDAASRLERFRREARAVSRLTHPHICALLDVGEQDGRPFLVMEHLDGETLATRLASGRLPLDRALRYGMQIAAALDAAHRQSIVHRDLKPSNIMITRDGVKLLDFGLAKLRPDADDALAASETADLTTEGTILGTVPYMAPEQLEGHEVDARADIFALGVVLYEMVAGQRPFVGDSKPRIMSAILEKEPPPVSTLQPLSPPVLDHVIQRCLAKDPEERWQTARDVGIALTWVAEGGSAAGLPASLAARRARRGKLWVAGAGVAVGVAAAGLMAWKLLPPPDTPARPPLRLELSLDPPALVRGADRALALSADGSRLAYVTGNREEHRLAVRLLTQRQSVALAGTEGAANPFFSPDGEWVAFFADGALKKVAAAGGAPVTLCAASGTGGGWGPGDTIVFGGGPGEGLLRVPAAGGTAEGFTALDAAKGERSHAYPHFLPGSDALLFTVTLVRGEGGSVTVLQDLRSGERQTLFAGYDARYLQSGHVAFIHGRSLFAARFDLRQRAVASPLVAMIEDLSGYLLYPIAQFDLSRTGTLVYAPTTVFVPRRFNWVDRQGNVEPLDVKAGLHEDPRVSHSGRQAALELHGDIWILDIARTALSRLTFGPGSRETPVWTPDDRRLAYGCHLPGEASGVCWRAADGSGTEERLFTRPNWVGAADWTPDGRTLLFIDNSVETGHDVVTFSLDGDRQPRPLLHSRFAERAPALSPDGRWIAYSSDESGRREVYVQPFPALGPKWQVSNDGGDEPVWSRAGGELLYRRGDDVRAVPLRLRPDFKAGLPTRLFTGSYQAFPQRPDRQYDVAPDGRFLMLKREGAADPPLVMVVDWVEELKSRLPRID